MNFRISSPLASVPIIHSVKDTVLPCFSVLQTLNHSHSNYFCFRQTILILHNLPTPFIMPGKNRTISTLLEMWITGVIQAWKQNLLLTTERVLLVTSAPRRIKKEKTHSLRKMAIISKMKNIRQSYSAFLLFNFFLSKRRMFKL